jgi:hypothetical protein
MAAARVLQGAQRGDQVPGRWANEGSHNEEGKEDMIEQGFTFQGTGTLKRVDLFESKGGKAIKTLILDIPAEGKQWPQTIPIKLWGRDAEKEYKPGDIITVSGRLGGRESNGRCWGDSTAMKVEVVGRDEEAGAPPADDQNTPF